MAPLGTDPIAQKSPASIAEAAATHSRLHRRLTVNSLSNLLRYGVSILLSFLLTPFVVRTLGDSLYGFWVVLLSFVGYAGILELGVQPAVIKLVGQHRVSADQEKFARLMGAAFVFFAGVGVLAALLFAFVLPPLLPYLAKHAPAALGSRVLFAVIAVDILLMFQNSFLTGILFGWQLYPAKNMVDIAAWVINAALLLAFLKSGGILFLASVKTATDLGALLATLVVVKRSLPSFRMDMRSVRMQTIRELLAFGGRLFVSASTTRVAVYAHLLVVSSRISTAATTFFSIPVRLVEYSREIAWSLAAGFMPAFSELEASGQHELIRGIYTRYSRYILIVTAPIYVLLFVYGAPFIGFWIGPEYGAKARVPLVLITAAALIESLQPLFWRLFIGIGRLDGPVAISAAASLASIAIGFLLAPKLGIAGPALAILLTGIIAQIYFTSHAGRYLGISFPRLVQTISARPLAGTGILFVFATELERTWTPRSTFHLGLEVVVVLFAYVPIAMLFVLNRDERQELLARSRRLLRWA